MFATSQAGAVLNDDAQPSQSVNPQQQQAPAAASVTAVAPLHREVFDERAVQQDFWDLSRQGFDAIVHANKCILPPSWAVRRKEMPTRYAELDLAFADVEAPMALTDYQRHQIENPTTVVSISNRVAVDLGYESDMAKRKKAGVNTPVDDDIREFILYIFQLMEHCQADSPLYAITFAQNGTKIVQCVIDFHADLPLAYRMLRVLAGNFSACFVEPTMGPGRQRYDPNATLIVRDFLIDRRLESNPIPTEKERQSGLLLTAHSYSKDDGISKEALRLFANLGASQMDIRSQATIGGVPIAQVIPHPIEDGCYYVACGTPALPYGLLSHCPSISYQLQVTLLTKFGILFTVAPCNTKFETHDSAAATNDASSTAAAPLELPPMPPPPEVTQTQHNVADNNNNHEAAGGNASNNYNNSNNSVIGAEEDDVMGYLYDEQGGAQRPEEVAPAYDPNGLPGYSSSVLEVPVIIMDDDADQPTSPGRGSTTTNQPDMMMSNNNNNGGYYTQQQLQQQQQYSSVAHPFYSHQPRPIGGVLGALPPLPQTADPAVKAEDDGLFDFGAEETTPTEKPSSSSENASTILSNADLAAEIAASFAMEGQQGGVASDSVDHAAVPSTMGAGPTGASTNVPVGVLDMVAVPAAVIAGFRPPPVAPSTGFRMVKKPVSTTAEVPTPPSRNRSPASGNVGTTVRVGGAAIHGGKVGAISSPISGAVPPIPSKKAGAVVAVPLDPPMKAPPPSEHYLTIPERNLQIRRRQALTAVFEHAACRKVILDELKQFLSAPEDLKFWLEEYQAPKAAESDVSVGVSKSQPHLVAAVSKPPPPARQAFAPVPPKSEHVNETATIETAEFNQHVKYDAIVRDYPPSLVASIGRWWHVTCSSLITSGAAGQYLYSHATPEQSAAIRKHLKITPIPASLSSDPQKLVPALDSLLVKSPLPLALPTNMTHPHCEVVVDVCGACNEGYNPTANKVGRGRGAKSAVKWGGTAIGLPPAPLSTRSATSTDAFIWAPAPYPPHGAPFDTTSDSDSSFSVGISNSHGLYYFKNSSGKATYLHPKANREYHATPQAVLFNHLSALTPSAVLELTTVTTNATSKDGSSSSGVAICYSDDEMVLEKGAKVLRKKPHGSTRLAMRNAKNQPDFKSSTIVDQPTLTADMKFASITPEEAAVAFSWEDAAKYTDLTAVGNYREQAAGDSAMWGTWGKAMVTLITRAAANLARFEAAVLSELYAGEGTPSSEAITAMRSKIIAARAQYKSEITTLLLAYFKPYLQMFTLTLAHYAYHLSDRGYLRRTKEEVARKHAAIQQKVALTGAPPGAKRPREDEQEAVVRQGQWVFDHMENHVAPAATARSQGGISMTKSSDFPTINLDGFELRDPKPLQPMEIQYRDVVRREQARLNLKANDGTVAEIKTCDHPSKAVLWTPGPTGLDADGGSGGLHITLTKVVAWLVDQNIRHELLDGYVMALLGTMYPSTLHGI